ncbi:MAG: energy transducer TonB [Methylococcaceae bacterium]|nr:energy transducer TonB [Methylococcaceae bacterium]
MQKKSPLLEVLTGEINHRYIAGLLAVAAILLHFWLVILLLEPRDTDKKAAPVKIMEVALITELPPKVEVVQPAPPKSAPPPPKKIQPPKPPPKKREVKPPVKQKETVVHKEGEIAKPKIVAKEAVTPPVLTNPFAKSQAPVSKPQAPAATASKPVAKSGAGDSNSKGANSGIVELGCPRPKYPARAMSRHLEGWVRVEVIISTAGTVTSATVVGSQPAGIFDDAALDATRGCRFKPKIVNGVAVTQKGVKKSTFRLSN